MNDTQAASWNTHNRVKASQRWRKLSAAMGRQVTEAIVAEARIQSGLRVLDIASGTGEPAISIATAMNGTGRVIATDISAEPLAVALERAVERGLPNFEARQADAQALPFGDDQFDRITCRLGAMFFPDADRAFAEFYRVLKPGGRASVLCWGTLKQPYFQSTLGTVLRTCPELSLPPGGMKMFKFSEPATITNAFHKAGFSKVHAREQEIPWNWPETPEELWGYFQEVTIPFKPLFDAVPQEARAKVDAAAVAELRNFYDGKSVNFLATMVLASATK